MLSLGIGGGGSGGGAGVGWAPKARAFPHRYLRGGAVAFIAMLSTLAAKSNGLINEN